MKNLLIILSFMIGAQLMAQQAATEKLVIIHTTFGDITAKLYNDTPKHRDNFIKLIKEGWYTDSPFHRVINGFMIQGGGSKDGQADPGYTIDAEILPHHFHKKGALAAARMPDNMNPKKKSSGSQFYIVQGRTMQEGYIDAYAKKTGVVYTDEQKKAYATIGGTPHLDGGYTVFGEVVDGFDVIDKIAGVKTGQGDKPVESVSMTIEILE